MERRRERQRDTGRGGEDRAGYGIIRSDDIRLRNHDHQWGYDLEIEVVTPAGGTAFEERYYLQPGQVEGESYVLPSGEYEIRVTLDNSHTETLQCRIDSDPEHTAVVEVGNGVLSLTEGIRD